MSNKQRVKKNASFHIMLHLNGNQGGGVKTVAELWHHGFCQRGVRVSYLLHGDGDYASYLKKDGRELYTIKMGRVRSRSWSFFGIRMPDVFGWAMSIISISRQTAMIRKILNKAKPDAVLGNGASSAAIIGPACKKTSIPLISCFHGVSHSNDFFSLRKRIIAFLVNRYCNKIVGVSQETIKGFSRFLHVPHHVIYNSVPEVTTDITTRLAFRKHHKIPESTIVFGTASRIAPARAIHIFIDAAEAFVQNHPDLSVVFLIAGEPHLKNDKLYLDNLLDRIDQKKLKAKIWYLGHQSIADFYSAIDIFCHTLEGVEALGLAVVEALSAGLPVIVADKGGFHEFLPKDIGIRYNSSSYEQLAKSMGKMLDESFRSEQSKKGRDFFKNKYITYDEWIDAWLKSITA